MLESIVEDPRRPVSALPTSDRAEVANCGEWTGTRIRAIKQPPKFEAQAKETPGADASLRPRRLSYRS